MLIVGCPFGNYFNYPGAISTLGTYTFARRHSRFRQVLRTVRYYPRLRAWSNQLGLRNPGISSLDSRITANPRLLQNKILSIHGFTVSEWEMLIARCIAYYGTTRWSGAVAIEANVSCPNVVDGVDSNDKIYKRLYNALGPQRVVVKLSPVGYVREMKQLWDAGLRKVHLCNTIPTPGGGISGKPLLNLSLAAVREVREEYPSAVIIGGGGVTCLEDVGAYRRAGADHVAIASMLFAPWNWRKPKQFVKYLNEPELSDGQCLTRTPEFL